MLQSFVSSALSIQLQEANERNLLSHFASPVFHIHPLKFEFQPLFPHHFIIATDNVVAVTDSFQ
jgi:hypothetical protein